MGWLPFDFGALRLRALDSLRRWPAVPVRMAAAVDLVALFAFRLAFGARRSTRSLPWRVR
jgi:hypothetical protein